MKVDNEIPAMISTGFGNGSILAAISKGGDWLLRLGFSKHPEQYILFGIETINQ